MTAWEVRLFRLLAGYLGGLLVVAWGIVWAVVS